MGIRAGKLEEIENVFNFLFSFYGKGQKSHVGVAAVLMLSVGEIVTVSSVSNANPVVFYSLGRTLRLQSVTGSRGLKSGYQADTRCIS